MGIRLFIRKLITYNTKDTSQWIRNWINKLYSKYGKMWPLGEERLSNAHCGNNLWRVQFSSVAQLCPALYDPMDCSMPGLPVHYQLPEFTQTHVHWVSDAIQPSHPLLSLLLPPSINPSIRVFSNKSVLCIRWPKYWSLSFIISPSNDNSGLISFRMDWLDLLVIQGTLKSLL